MRRVVEAVLILASGLIALVIGFWIFTEEAPLYLHLMYADYRDPRPPHHLIGRIVTTPELLIHTIEMVACILLFFWLLRRLLNHRAHN